MEINKYKYIIDSVISPKFTEDIGILMSCNCNCDNNEHYQTMSNPAEYDFTIHKGSSLNFDIVYKDKDKRPINLTGYKVKCVAQYNTKSFTINAKIIDPCNGYINMNMSPYETSRIFTIDYKYINHTEYNYQLNLISPSNEVYRIMEGVINVIPGAGIA